MPAARVEVVQAPLPLDEQVAADELAQARAVARVPCQLDVREQLRGLAGHAVGVECGVVLRCLGGGQHHLLHALAPAPAHARGPDGADRGDDDEREDDQREEDEAAAPPPEPPPPPKPPPPRHRLRRHRRRRPRIRRSRRRPGPR